MSLEPVVRPFQDRLVAPAVLILPDVDKDEPKAMSIGSEGGTTFSFSYSFSGSAKSSGGDDWKETKRKTQTVRVTNPDDPDNFVDTQRATRVQFNDTRTGKAKRAYNFQYPDSNAVG